MFYLKYIKVSPDSMGKKILSNDDFQLIDSDFLRLPKEFYGENIVISAIVGKNGSGKSTLLDLIYRVLNNLNAILCANLNSTDSTAFSFISKVKVSLGFDVDGEEYEITCGNDSVRIHYKGSDGDKRVFFGCGSAPDGYTHLKELSDKDRQEIANGIFYCMAINYAPFAMNSSEYEHELCLGIDEKLSPGRIDLKNHNWMRSVFHKNDGYQSNITFVPFRDNGIFNATNEAKLNRERILEILVTHNDFINGYRLSNVRLRVDKDIFKDKFKCTRPSRANNYNPPMEVNEVLSEFTRILEDYKKRGTNTIATRILNVFGYKRGNIVLKEPFIYAYLYIVYKVLNAAQYPSFMQYQRLYDTDLAIDRNADKDLRVSAIMLAKAVKGNHSHITFKIERAINFLSVAKRLNWEKICSQGYTLEEYWLLFPEKLTDASVIVKARHLPPSFFKSEVFLVPDGEIGKEWSFEQLSSGERQFYSTISSIVYHSMNLISAHNDTDRVKYRNVLVVLDEIEMCFHPEYQRSFLNNLISTIKRLNFNKRLSFHFLLTSHSPFILSDIPSSNILYLSKGIPLRKDKFDNPFGANINDILAQSFFLDKGFIGQYSKEIISSLFEFLNSTDQKDKDEGIIDWDQSNSRYAISIIGEPLLRDALQRLYSVKFDSIEKLQQEKKRIEELIRLKSQGNAVL